MFDSVDQAQALRSRTREHASRMKASALASKTQEDASASEFVGGKFSSKASSIVDDLISKSLGKSDQSLKRNALNRIQAYHQAVSSSGSSSNVIHYPGENSERSDKPETKRFARSPREHLDEGDSTSGGVSTREPDQTIQLTPIFRCRTISLISTQATRMHNLISTRMEDVIEVAGCLSTTSLILVQAWLNSQLPLALPWPPPEMTWTPMEEGGIRSTMPFST